MTAFFRRYIALLVAFAVFLVYMPASYCQPPRVEKPEWEVCGEMACLTEENARRLVSLWADYNHLYQTLGLEVQRAKSLDDALQAAKSAAGTERVLREKLQKELARTRLYVETVRHYYESRERAAWTVALVAVSAAASAAAVFLVKF